MTKGKFIVLYGANNLGKSTQVTLIQKYLETTGVVVHSIKYPVYDLLPTGPRINSVLREGKKMAEQEVQELYVQNRRDYEPTILQWLTNGEYVIAEDYVGTGIAWGLVRGVSLEVLEQMNMGLRKPDVSILLFGERFQTGRETNHRNETDDELWQLATKKHDFLALRYHWDTVYANQSQDKVHQDIVSLLEKKVGI